MDAGKMWDAEEQWGQSLLDLSALWGRIQSGPLVCRDPSSPLLSPVSPSTVGFFQLVTKIPLPLRTLPPPHVLGGIWG